jgi:hypothetical protein
MFENCEGYIEIRAFQDGTFYQTPNRFFETHKINELNDFCEHLKKEYCDIYFGVNPRITEQSGKKENIEV